MNNISENKDYTARLLERFLKYVRIWSESDGKAADAGVFPSTERQRDFAAVLAADMGSLGMSDVQVTKDCYVYGRLEATGGANGANGAGEGTDGEAAAHCPAETTGGTGDTSSGKSPNTSESVLFLAHMDTVDEVTGKDVKPQVFENYDGRDIRLENGVVHTTKTDENLAEAAQNRETIITTDGTTLLGGDDKAGICAILAAVEFLHDHPETPHGTIEVIFSPDEETGHGMDKVPLELIRSKCAYTVDGGHIGELESECFNAWGAEVIFTGKATHTGDAKKNGMVNAVSMAGKFLSILPHTMTPETTEGYEGFIAPMEVEGSIDTCKVQLLLRSFLPDEIERQKRIVSDCAEAAAITFNGKKEVKFRQQYLNMKEKLSETPWILERLRAAYRAAGVAITEKPIRGGTDGSRLTEMGIPCPNIFTGGHNFHSRFEWVSLNQMAKVADILVNLGRI